MWQLVTGRILDLLFSLLLKWLAPEKELESSERHIPGKFHQQAQG
jgi:hypothetical protein